MKRILTSCFGLGLLPGAPGTAGSLPVVIIFFIMVYYGLPVWLSFIVLALLVLAGGFVCVRFAPAVISATGKKDPREVVADEFAGQAVTFLFILPFVSVTEVFAVSVLGFLLFRLFDIVKPYPVRGLERLPAGTGILADDLGAGVYAGICLLIALKTGLAGFISSNLCSEKETLNIFTAGLLGLVQGLTEFLPVSSSGHLVLFEHLFGFDAEKPQMLLFDLVVHTGTVIAIIIVFYKSIANFLKDIVSYKKYGTDFVGVYKKNPSFHILVLALITTAVTGPLGILFEDFFIRARGSLPTVAVMWVITGTVLIVTDFRKRTRVGLRQFGVISAVVIGLAQAIAIMPGISRSGATISAAILLGLHRRWAVEYSFLIGIPAILGATAVEFVKNIGQISSEALPVIPLAAGFILAIVSGAVAIRVLMKVARKGRLKFFAFYCYLLAFFVLIYCLK
jgi:undecaprenyl-diphosphatase